jgi:hypothetical protein
MVFWPENLTDILLHHSKLKKVNKDHWNSNTKPRKGPFVSTKSNFVSKAVPLAFKKKNQAQKMNEIYCAECSGADPYFFEPLGSASGFASHSYGSGSGSFHYQAKIVRKTLISTVL